MQSIVIHAHFYQPPREDPWTEVVERQHAAAPWHDWNRRIEQECYRPLTAARLVDAEGRITGMVNCFERLSFNVGATLLEWLEREAPATYAAILVADRVSRTRLGHGNALAMPYHHIIMPLASRRDKVTEVRWGIRDFRRRFGREPEGMWLPETAVDEETLDVLAQEDVHFTVLAPHQVTEAPLHGLPGAARTTSGKRITLFLYDGPLAHDVAFGPLLRDAVAWAHRLQLPPDDVGGPKLVSLATDGETFGHHHKFAEMALAATFDRLEGRAARVENFASFLAAHPPHDSVTLAGPSSWSCPHGVERWRSDCGCRLEAGTSQAWRTPLREALDWVKVRLDARFEAEAGPLLGDAWAARDGADPGGDATDLPERASELLDMQRNALRMFTSCAWFFDDIGGLEGPQAMGYAVKAAEYATGETDELVEGLRQRLALARSNDPALGTGADLLDHRVCRPHPVEWRVAAGIAALAQHAPVVVPLGLGVYDVLQATPTRVVIRQRRTRRIHRFHTAVSGSPTGQLDIQVADGADTSPTVHLSLPDVPEPARELLRRHVQAKLIPAVLDRGEREGVASGVLAYADALRDAMLRHLGEDAVLANVAALSGALDLLVLDRRPVPFEVQTRCYQLWSTASPAGRVRLAPLLPAFGFAASLANGPP